MLHALCFSTFGPSNKILLNVNALHHIFPNVLFTFYHKQHLKRMIMLLCQHVTRKCIKNFPLLFCKIESKTFIELLEKRPDASIKTYMGYMC